MATLTFLGDLLRGHLKKIRSRWRKLPPGQIATIVLSVLRHDQRLADIAGDGFQGPAVVGPPSSTDRIGRHQRLDPVPHRISDQ